MAAMKAAMKAMKAMKAAKAMKAMKAKRVPKVGKRAAVLKGSKEKTSGGLKKSDLMKNKAGKVVSKKSSAAGKKAYGAIKGWTAAVQKARKQLGVKGFVAIKKGSPLYNAAKALYKK